MHYNISNLGHVTKIRKFLIAADENLHGQNLFARAHIFQNQHCDVPDGAAGSGLMISTTCTMYVIGLAIQDMQISGHSPQEGVYKYAFKKTS